MRRRLNDRDYWRTARAPHSLPALRPPGTSYPGGADEAEIADLQQAVAAPLPMDLVGWLRACKGDLIGPGGLYGVRYSPNVTDIASARDWFPNWRQRGWLPVAGDGNGDYYVYITSGELSGCIVDLPVVPASQGHRRPPLALQSPPRHRTRPGHGDCPGRPATVEQPDQISS